MVYFFKLVIFLNWEFRFKLQFHFVLRHQSHLGTFIPQKSCKKCKLCFKIIILHFSLWKRSFQDIHIIYKPFHKWSFNRISRPKLRKFQKLLFKTIICVLFLLISPVLCYFAHLSRQRSRANYEKESSQGSKRQFINHRMHLT